jgi:hypothetical protein
MPGLDDRAPRVFPVMLPGERFPSLNGEAGLARRRSGASDEKKHSMEAERLKEDGNRNPESGR